MAKVELIKNGKKSVLVLSLSDCLKMKALEKYGYSVTILGKKVCMG